ncbi:MAG: DUF2017 family protein [Jatrophihabitantaceae bacterium]
MTRSGPGVRVRLNLPEGHMLEQLLGDLQDSLEPGALDPADPVRERLYPSGYEGAEDAAAFRELTEAGLQADRSERVDACLAELLQARSIVRTDLLLGPEAADRWIRVLNDIRLALGTRLGVCEDDDMELDTAAPDVQDRARYMWLTALQDLLVTTLMA